MEDRSTFAWAVLYPLDAGFGRPGSPVIGTVAGTRKGAMEAFVADWRTGSGLTVSKVWQKAYARGWRLAHVQIQPLHFGADQ